MEQGWDLTGSVDLKDGKEKELVSAGKLFSSFELIFCALKIRIRNYLSFYYLCKLHSS